MSWLLRTTNLVVSHWRYLSANVMPLVRDHAYASVISANTPTAPAIALRPRSPARSDFGLRGAR